MTEAIQSPTSSYPVNPKWNFASNAFSSNNEYAFTGIGGSSEGYFNYGFDGVLPPILSITKVEIGLEFYCLVGESLQIRISIDGGVTWSGWSARFTLTTESMLWVNVTTFKALWLRDYLLDANWRVEVKFSLGVGAGCPLKEAWTAYLDWIPTKVTYGLAKRMYGDGLTCIVC